MIRLLLVVAIVGLGALLLTDRVSLTVPELPAQWEVSLPSLNRNPLSPEISERELVIETGDLEVHFERQGAFKAEHMLFGGLNTEPRNTLRNATLAVLDMDDARALGTRYPDFHRYSSPGAAQAQQQVRSLSVIAIDGATRDQLHDAVDLHTRRARESGDRICVVISGEVLALSSVRLRESGRDVSAQSLSAHSDTQFLLAREVEISDCANSLDR